MPRPRRKAARFDVNEPPEIPGLSNLTLLGVGGSAAVYKARQTAMNRDVAVKVLMTQMEDAETRRNFQAECEAAGRLSTHKFVADVYHGDFHRGFPYILMKYYVHRSLEQRLSLRDALPVDEALSLGVRIAGALQFAHDQGILHRDVKPANILLDYNGEPQLSDFGIAVDRDTPSAALRYAMTAVYAAPEVLRNGGGSAPADVWSLAATVYAALAGRPPFHTGGDPDPGVLRERAICGPLPVIEHRTDIPEQLHACLRSALIGEPSRRTGSAEEFGRALNEVERDLGLAPTPWDDGPGSETNAPRSARRAPSGRVPDQPRAPAEDPPEGGAGNLRVPWETVHGMTDYSAPVPEPPKPSDGIHIGVPIPGGGPRRDPDRPRVMRPSDHQGMQTDVIHWEAPPEPEESAAAGSTRRRPMLVAGGSVLAIGVIGGGFVALQSHQATAAQPAGAISSAPVSAAAPASSPAAASTPIPPDGVTVVASGTGLKVSWHDPEGNPQHFPVVITLGAGHTPTPVTGGSPQVLTGLDAAKPYCVAVGYVYSLDGRAAYSTPECVRGGQASPK
ncbi:serine/threonine protein kinase [Catenulispora sp. GAS73]|uniref:serine/threonine-protein kinase n=1 Tax=Catenulispora sp. GAS73 TaxID=3156269 RepID=UPI0035187FA9